MTDRLRRLDALFAEKVLGCKIQPSHRNMTAYDGAPPIVTGESATGDFGCSYGTIPHYTRSLDAAWEGASLVKGYEDFNVGRRCSLTPGYGPGWTAEFWVVNDASGDLADIYANASHPAEALVLACLRAVGCSEEELA